MKKKVIVFIVAVLLILLPLCGYTYYDLFVTDDYGDEYSQAWSSTDGKLEFISKNKKGFLGHNYMYYGKIITESGAKEASFGFSSLCSVRVGNDEYFSGDYDYDLLSKTVVLEVDYVNEDLCYFYKVGDKITIRQTDK